MGRHPLKGLTPSLRYSSIILVFMSWGLDLYFSRISLSWGWTACILRMEALPRAVSG